MIVIFVLAVLRFSGLFWFENDSTLEFFFSLFAPSRLRRQTNTKSTPAESTSSQESPKRSRPKTIKPASNYYSISAVQISGKLLYFESLYIDRRGKIINGFQNKNKYIELYLDTYKIMNISNYRITDGIRWWALCFFLGGGKHRIDIMTLSVFVLYCRWTKASFIPATR